MESKQRSTDEEQLETAVGRAPGAIAPTGGSVPEDAQAQRGQKKHDLDELVDALGLLLRAARDLDPAQSDSRLRALEAMSEQTITALQTLSSGTSQAHDDRNRSERVAKLATATRSDLVAVIERALDGIRASLLARE